MSVSRRQLIAGAMAGAAMPQIALARNATEITWEDLIPPGVPYSEIIGDGEMDWESDTWRPIFDENATKLNPTLNGAYVKLPGFIIPIDFTTDGVTGFVLVPYVGACVHVPPPPPNQLVFVTTVEPWPNDQLWDAVWVIGRMHHEMQETEVAETGYAIAADRMEVYVWE